MKPIFVVMYDDRCAYHTDKNYPDLIYLATALRWSVEGITRLEKLPASTDTARRYNSRVIDSTADFLADNIESGDIPIFSCHSKLLLGSAEKSMVVRKLRSFDEGRSGGLIDDEGLGYYLDGNRLFRAVMRSSLPTSDDFDKGGVWHYLLRDAPRQWRENLGEEFSCVGKDSAGSEVLVAESVGTDLPGVKTTDIIQAFALAGKNWIDSLRPQANIYWKAIHTPGGRGKGMHTWKPSVFAICLLEDRERKYPSQLRKVIKDNWPDWLPDFESKLEDHRSKSGD